MNLHKLRSMRCGTGDIEKRAQNQTKIIHLIDLSWFTFNVIKLPSEQDLCWHAHLLWYIN